MRKRIYVKVAGTTAVKQSGVEQTKSGRGQPHSKTLARLLTRDFISGLDNFP